MNLLSTIKNCVQILEPADRRKYWFVMVIQACLGILDLISVAILGVIGALAIRGVQSQQPGNQVSKVLNFIHIENFSFQTQIGILGTASMVLLIGKTLATVILSRKILFFLGRKGAELSTELISRTLAQPILGVQAQTSYFIQYGIASGVSAVIFGVLGTASTLIADFSLLVIISIGVVLIDPFVALSALILFSIIGLVLYLVTHKRARLVGNEIAELSLETNELLGDVLEMYREIFVRNRRSYYSGEIGKVRKAISVAYAEQTFLPNITKYVVEVAVVVGSLLIAAVQFLIHDSSRAVSSLAVFAVAAGRIAPSLLRLQASLVQIQSNIGNASPTLAMVERLKQVNPLEKSLSHADFTHEGFDSTIKLKDVSFRYPDSNSYAIQGLNLEVLSGSFTAIVGPSGAGKSSLSDLMLGIHKPTSGFVEVSGVEPELAIKKWPGAISYVPQKVGMSDRSIKENIGIGYSVEEISDDLVNKALKSAQLDEFISTLPSGFETLVGENGAKLSGGQRQRIGIARALYSNPKLLILDEATSSLDGQTEAAIAEAISKLRGSTTLVMIAHRLSTIRSADKVIYLEGGKVLCSGTFNEVRARVPDFDEQAKLMGL